MNIEAVAKRAGVSIATVSRVINGHKGVSSQTANRVRTIIGELAYTPNRTAKSLVSGRSHLLGVIVSDITNPFFPEIINSFDDIASQHGYDIITVSSNYDPQRTEHAVHRLMQRSVDGIAIMTSEFDPAIITRLTNLAVPMVFLDIGTVANCVSNVRVDYEGGIKQALDHLLELGHRTIGFIAGPEHLRSAQIRKRAFLQLLGDSGLTPNSHLIAESNHKIDGGLAAGARILPFHPTAILASNDLSAIGVLQAARRASKLVPEELSIIGFDDIQFSQFTDPPLSTVRLARDAIATASFEALLYASQAENGVGCERKVSTQLVVRSSTGPVRQPVIES